MPQVLRALTERVGIDDEPLVRELGDRSLVLFDSGDEVVVQAGEEGVRFLLVSGNATEPAAWRGPIVMNTQQELMQAYSELRNGTFIKEQ
ncbi:MAG: pirin-like C-terminal cupin domain-containing protein [Candidatus Eisenbacteria bacterium]